MNIQGLIERYEKFKASKKKMISVDLVLKDLRSLDEPESLPFKLKDVVGRIRGFDPITQDIWLNKILDELGSDYGLMKYRSGYEQGKIEGAWVGNQLKDADKIRQELNRPVIPQFVADWYEENKDDFEVKLFRVIESFSTPYEEGDPIEFMEWLNDENNKPFQTLVNMHQFGYEVEPDPEKEKRYYIRLKGVDENYNYLTFIKHLHAWVLDTIKTDKKFRSTHTRKELEEAGFGEVFNSPLFEVVEVE